MRAHPDEKRMCRDLRFQFSTVRRCPILSTHTAFLLRPLKNLRLQMRDIQMPLGSIGNKNVAVRAMRISDFVNFHVRR
jgi:hypothetical protein